MNGVAFYNERNEYVNTRLLCFNIKVRRSVSSRVRGFRRGDSTTLGVVISNLMSCVRKGRRLVYSRDKFKKVTVRKYNRKQIKVADVIKAIDYLEEVGYITNHIGVGSRSREFRKISFITPTQKFINTFCEDINLVKEVEMDYVEDYDCIILRDMHKVAIDFHENEYTHKIRDSVKAINKLNESADIRNKDGVIMDNLYARIFNGSFDLGGRYYRADIVNMKNRGTDDRVRITIDNKSVCEVDFTSLHLMIAMVLEDIPKEEVPLDPYTEILDDPTNKVERHIIKMAINMMFNCPSKSVAMKAIQMEINKLSPEDKELFTLGTAKSVMALILMSYSSLDCLFCRDGVDNFGMVLQNSDSVLASSVLDKMVECGIPCLVIHDSFIVSMDNMNLLCDTMGDSFREVFECDWNVPVKVKYINHDGDVEESKIFV